MKIDPAVSVVGHVGVPGDKSISHRAVMFGALGEGETHVHGFGRGGDTMATVHAMRALGAGVDDVSEDELVVHGVGVRGLRAPDAPVDCENAGTLIRLVAGVLAGQEGRFELTGDESLRSRPMERIAEPLRRMGASVETTDGRPPVVINGSGALRANRLRASRRERAGEVGRAARRAERGGRDDRRRARADARPHGADARGGRRARAAAARPR